MPERIALALLALAACCGSAEARVRNDGATLVRAIRNDDVVATQAALAVHGSANQRLDFGATPLAMAVNTQDPALVEVLLAAHARPNVADADGVTPLALACELGNPAIVTKLLDAHADVRAAAPDGTTPLAVCARFGPAEAVTRMLAMGARADTPDSRGQTPLMWAASTGHLEAIAALLKAGADVNRVANGGFTPLFFAIKSGVPAATQVLLAAGAKADYRGPEHTSALQLALYQHNYGAAALLVPGADLAERDREGRTPLAAAAEGGDTALIALLIAQGAAVNALTAKSRITWVTEANFGMAPPPVPPTPPLLIAAQHGRAEAMTLLAAHGADSRFVAADGSNVVLAATLGRSVAALAVALALAPNANAADASSATALHRLAGGTDFPDLADMVRLLAAHGGRADIANTKGVTAAAIASGGRSEVKAIFSTIFPDGAGKMPANAGGPQLAAAVTQIKAEAKRR
jgi:ankyrin repeat protein